MEAIDRAKSPPGRDAYTLGETAAMFMMINEIDTRLRAVINASNNGEDEV